MSKNETPKPEPHAIGQHALYEMGRKGFTANEIAQHFGVSRRQFFYILARDGNLHLAFAKGRTDFKAKLLRKLHENALKIGHTRSLITLAKQFGIGGVEDRDWPNWIGG